MSQCRAAACAFVGAEEEQVLGYRETAEGIVILVDWGIAGVKKYAIAIEELQPTAPADEQTLAPDPKPKTAATKRTRRAPKKAE